MRRQSRLVTVTALVACGTTPSLPASEPASEPISEPASEPAPEAEVPAPREQPRQPLNARDDQHRLIYVTGEGSCFVELPFPAGERPPPGKRPPTRAVDCPPEMASSVWTQCSGGTIWPRVGDDGCECRIMSNPPPAPRPIDCP